MLLRFPDDQTGSKLQLPAPRSSERRSPCWTRSDHRGGGTPPTAFNSVRFQEGKKLTNTVKSEEEELSPRRTNADTSFVLLDVTCSARGLVVHMQIFAT